MKTWSDAAFQERGLDHRRRPRRPRPWLFLTAAAATALIIYQFPLIKATILQHCSRRGANSDVFSPQWEYFNWNAVSGSAFPSALVAPSLAFTSRNRLNLQGSMLGSRPGFALVTLHRPHR